MEDETSPLERSARSAPANDVDHQVPAAGRSKSFEILIGTSAVGGAPEAQRVPNPGRRLPILLRAIVLAFVALGAAANGVALSRSGHANVVLAAVGLTLIGLAVVIALLALTGPARVRRGAQSNARSERRWRSRTGAYLGPFDPSGLAGAEAFAKRNSVLGRPPAGMLEVDFEAIRFVVRGQRHERLSIPLDVLRSVELIPGRVRYKPAVTAENGWELGQVRISTTDGKQANFTGIPVDHLAAFLQRLGGHVRTAIDQS